MKNDLPQIRIFADFHNADRLGRIRLNTAGAEADLKRAGMSLHDGMLVILDDGEEFDELATVRLCPKEGWVAELSRADFWIK